MTAAPPVRRPRLIRYAWLLVPAILVGALIVVNSNHDVYGPGGVERIDLVDGRFVLALLSSAVVSLATLCVAGWLRPARFPHPIVSGLLGIALTCGGFTGLGVEGFTGWRASSPVVG